ncbi:hypothetical protein GCM10027194_07610 [Thalassiella azotivora]
MVAERERCYSEAESSGWGSRREGDRLVAADGLLDRLTAEDYHPTFFRMWRQEALHRLAHRSELVQYMGQLMGAAADDVLVHPYKVLRWQWPGEDPGTAGVHQDYPELQGSERQLTMWIPFHCVDSDTGALPIYRGSHLRGVRALELADNPSGWQTRLRPGERPDVGRLRPGDVLIFTTFTVHGGAVNRTSTFRLSMDARYQPVADPLCASAVELPGFPYSWSETCAEWSPEMAHYWERLPLRLHVARDTWERWRDREALRLGSQGDSTALTALALAADGSPDPAVRDEARAILRSRIGMGA